MPKKEHVVQINVQKNKYNRIAQEESDSVYAYEIDTVPQ